MERKELKISSGHYRCVGNDRETLGVGENMYVCVTRLPQAVHRQARPILRVRVSFLVLGQRAINVRYRAGNVTFMQIKGTSKHRLSCREGGWVKETL